MAWAQMTVMTMKLCFFILGVGSVWEVNGADVDVYGAFFGCLNTCLRLCMKRFLYFGCTVGALGGECRSGGVGCPCMMQEDFLYCGCRAWVWGVGCDV